ncbi:hypothetical protein OG427_06985 [Streptomyces sp. NBC_00133]|uniref:hypothetical protein n=1 Tax=Streptomyces sp. NBC_00133 TaxID=2903624 RepID=UPI0032521CD6
MRLRTTTTALGLTALTLLALPGCSNNSPAATGSSSPAAAQPKTDEGDPKPSAPLSSAALRERLLNESDLGEGYTLQPARASGHDDVTVIGCPALDKLGGEAAAGGSLDFLNKAKVSFTSAGGSDSEVAEELYSDTEAKLSKGIGEIFDAMVSCPTYQVVSGGTVISIATQKVPLSGLGDEQWSQLLTFTVGGRSSVVKQTAVRHGSILMVVSGSTGLVDTHLKTALEKATSSSS